MANAAFRIVQNIIVNKVTFAGFRLEIAPTPAWDPKA